LPSLIELNENKIIDLYNKYRSLRKVAKILYISVEPVRRVLYSNQVKMNSSRLYKVNENYFENIDTEHKAYWLGFLYADGCVRIERNCLTFKQHKRDKDMFIKFNQYLNSNYPFRIVKNTNTYQIAITSKKLVKDLVSKGCVPRKSLILVFPKESILATHLQKHFIRGYFDGDGSISITKTHKLPVLNIAGTENVTESIKKILIKNGMKNVRVEPYASKKVKNKLWYTIISNKKDVLTFYEYVYKGATIFMERKHNKFIEIIEGKYLEYHWNTAPRKRNELGRYV